MSRLSYSEALEHLEKNNIKTTKTVKKALDELYPNGHELVYIDEVEEMVEKNYKNKCKN